MHEALYSPEQLADDQRASLPAPRNIAVVYLEIIVEIHLSSPEINLTRVIAGVVVRA